MGQFPQGTKIVGRALVVAEECAHLTAMFEKAIEQDCALVFGKIDCIVRHGQGSVIELSRAGVGILFLCPVRCVKIVIRGFGEGLCPLEVLAKRAESSKLEGELLAIATQARKRQLKP